MRKIFSLCILILTLCLSSTVFGVSEVSWLDFKGLIYSRSSLDLDYVLNEEHNSSIADEFRNNFENKYCFWVAEDWYWTEIPDSGVRDVTTLYFCFFNNTSSNSRPKIDSNNSQIIFSMPASACITYSLDIHTNTLTKLSSGRFLIYNIVSFPNFSPEFWNTLDTVEYFLNKVSVAGYKSAFTTNFGIIEQTSDIVSSPFPSDDEDDGGNENDGENSGDNESSGNVGEDSGNGGENGGDVGSDIEDYLPYFISVPAYPQKNECLVYFYVGDYGLNNLSFLIEKIDDSGAILSSNTLSTSIINDVNYGMAKVDFCKYFKFEDNSFYKITLVGKNGVKLDTSSVIYFLGSNTGNYEGDKPYIINAPKGYVRNSGDVVVTVYIPSGYDYEDSVYLSVQKYNLSGDYIGSTVVGDSNIWFQLDSESGICPIYVSSFCDFDISGNYYYRINLNEFNNGILDTTDIFYFDIDTGENIDKDNLPINPNNPSFNFDATDMEGLINSTTTWTNTIFSFLNIFPPWLITSIMAGIAVVVICRILGR